MRFLEVWVQGSPAKALGWTLIHSLWEGAAVALALMVVLGVAKSARVRYWAGCGAMLVLLAGFVATFYRLMPRETGVAARAAVSAAVALPAEDTPVGVTATAWELSDLLPWLAPVWMAGVLLFQLRCLASWAAAGRLRRTGVFDAPDAWMARLDALRARLRMTRPVRLLESCALEVPVVIGHVRPVILMPVGLLAGLPVAQIESILLHELAHIRRADYVVNLMQKVVEGLLFYHPAVWWISRVIRAERENCCDDLAVRASGDAHEYAMALAALAENRWAVSTAIAATGGNLVRRIRRVLAQPEGPRAGMAPALSAGVLIVTCAVALAAWQAPQQNGPAIVPVVPVAQVPVLKSQAEPKRGRSMLFAQNNPSPQADAALTPYRNWLNEEVVYIITARERAAFLQLKTDEERNMFIKQFWARRDPMIPTARDEYPVIAKGNPENEYKKEHYRRIKYVNDRFTAKIPGWKTDRGRIYILYGPPDEIESHPDGGKYTPEGGGAVDTVPFEQWRYRWIDKMGQNVIMEFVDKERMGEYRLTMDPHEKDVPPAKQEEASDRPGLILKFTSKGTGEKAVVFVGPDKAVRASLPIDYDATRLKAVLTSAGGKTIGRVGMPLADPCEGKPADSGCHRNYMLPLWDGLTLPAGYYNLTAVVTDSSTWAEKTYAVNFSVK